MVKKKKKRNGSRDYFRSLKTGEYEIIVSKKKRGNIWKQVRWILDMLLHDSGILYY